MLKLTGDVGVLKCQYGSSHNRIDALTLVGVIDVLGLAGIFYIVSQLCA